MAIVKLSKTRYVKRKKDPGHSDSIPRFKKVNQLVGGLEPMEFYDFPNRWDDDPIWLSLHHFSEGWLNHQLDKVNREAFSELQIRNQCSWN